MYYLFSTDFTPSRRPLPLIPSPPCQHSRSRRSRWPQIRNTSANVETSTNAFPCAERCSNRRWRRSTPRSNFTATVVTANSPTRRPTNCGVSTSNRLRWASTTSTSLRSRSATSCYPTPKVSAAACSAWRCRRRRRRRTNRCRRESAVDGIRRRSETNFGE